jgi:hypothetical protein
MDCAHAIGNSIQQASPIHSSTPSRQQDLESYNSSNSRNQMGHHLLACATQKPPKTRRTTPTHTSTLIVRS